MVAPPLPVVYDPEKVGEQFDADHPWELAEDSAAPNAEVMRLADKAAKRWKGLLDRLALND